MHNVMELGDAQSGKTHTMMTMQRLSIPGTIEVVHHIRLTRLQQMGRLSCTNCYDFKVIAC